MNSHFRWLIIIIVITLFSAWVALPDNEGASIDINDDGTPELEIKVTQSLGLDLVGGLRVLLQAELPPEAYTADDLRQTANNVGRRVNALGVTEPTVQIRGSDSILVELPGIDDAEVAVSTIQQTALLEFVDLTGLRSTIASLEGQRLLTTQQLALLELRGDSDTSGAVVNPLTGMPFETVMTGSGLQAASAQLEQTSWFIRFELTPDGSAIFGDYTASHVNEPLGIVLDGVLISAPRIDSRLDGGGVISGQFTEQEAKQLALQLRSGALPIPLRVESTATVGATLGQESVNLSIRAGIIGVLVVLMFLLIYYRVPGLAAALALLIFILLNYALFKLIPITITLPGITGFLISIGTAVDGNILIFERIKEELRAGNALDESLEAGFDRAWQSIRDSNFSTIIICGVLFLFGLTPGASIVSGFAITLALGLVLNLFTAVIVTRTFLHLLIAILRQPLSRHKWLLGV